MSERLFFFSCNMKIFSNYDLTKLNTFGVEASAKSFVEISDEKDILELFSTKEFKDNEKLFLGGGSNILFTKDFDGIVILNKLKGIEIMKEEENDVYVRSMGGEYWHDLVLFAVDKGHWGIENMALIPGTVGASPVQNIGAYGVELKDILFNVEAYAIENGEKKTFSKEECRLGYRDSIFKNELKGKYFISALTLKLNKKENFNINYKALEEYFKKNNLQAKNLKDVSDAVVNIRQSKLPDPKDLGSAGSFFKNVYVDDKKINELKEKYIDMPSFKEGDLNKIPAGWLVEVCGWKGKRVGNVGVYEKQALVLVNHGGATGQEIKNLALEIMDSVKQKFGLEITPEVNFI